ncbi:hypothetical protein B0H13DRAFT_2365780 [Mycena leptocephala]|nr:hypothetical protein B0H13DRAFT_2365780 [Mycena leptocephala]
MPSSLEDRTRLAEIEAQIRNLELSLAELPAEKTHVQERSTYPVLTLPNEIVSEIFIHFLPLRPLCPPLTGLLSPTTLTQICRQWREVAQATPELWRAIPFSDNRTPLEAQLHICDIWLSRSRGYPLSIRINRPARWEDFTLHISVSSFPNLDGPMPLLRFLDVALFDSHFFEFHEAPLLRTACLDGVAASCGTLPWLQLTCLTLRYISVRECASVLQKTTNLVHCTLSVSGTSTGHPDIVLPSLESLTFDRNGYMPATRYLTTFIVPALRSLEVPERSLGPNPINITSWIQFRTAPVHFYHVKAHAGNRHNEAADAAAKAGADLPLPNAEYAPCPAPAAPLRLEIPLEVQKVTCDIPELVAQSAPTYQPNVQLEVSTNPHDPSVHRNRSAHRAIQRAHLKRLTDASSNSAAFWKVYRSMADPKPRAPAVSLSDLAACFEKRMNAADPPPPEFNLDRKRVVEERVRNIPNPSGDPPSGNETLNRRVTEEDIEWAKDHLRSHYKTAVGLDRLHYQEILDIENDVLCKLINECLERNDAPLVWFTTLIAAIPKKDKPLSDPNSYRTIGLESCFLKLVCLLIHKRIYTWAEDKE